MHMQKMAIRTSGLTMDSVFFVLCFALLTGYATVMGQLNGGSRLLMLSLSTPSITKFVNDSLMISCITVQKEINTRWRDERGVAVENTKGRIHVEKKPGQLALVFEHIALSDKGNWTCESLAELAETGGVAAKSFELLVNQKISFDRTELVQSAREGRDATVKCLVKGDPAPDISWLHNGKHIVLGGNSSKYVKVSDGLFIKNVGQSDAGEYTCRALQITPTFSDSNDVTILLRIQHKPHWFNEDVATERYAYIGGTVNISCNAMGEPPPSFNWIHEGRAIVGPNYRIFLADYGSTLQIHVKNDSQLGDYKCKVTNSLGKLERIIKLRRGQKPMGPSRFQLKRIFTDGFELDIRSVKYSNVEENMHPISYCVAYMSQNDFKFSAGNWSYAKRREFSFYGGGRLLISGLERNTTYLLRAASRNLAGLSDWSQVKIFATLSAASTHMRPSWLAGAAILLGWLWTRGYCSPASN